MSYQNIFLDFDFDDCALSKNGLVKPVPCKMKKSARKVYDHLIKVASTMKRAQLRKLYAACGVLSLQ
jgi:hypothetical protein